MYKRQALLRAIGNSVIPLLFLGISAILNILLDLICVLVFSWGVAGAAAATVFSQFVSGIGIMLYTLVRFPEFRIQKKELSWNSHILKEITSFSEITCVQQ